MFSSDLDFPHVPKTRSLSLARVSEHPTVDAVAPVLEELRSSRRTRVPSQSCVTSRRLWLPLTSV
jgi:hypothetical protein